jgi:putative ABC transport system permease protein
MAVGERTREIGILRAVGWSKARIVRSLVVESLVLCLLSGLLGNLLALLFLRALEGTGSTGFGWVPVVVPLRVFWASLSISGIVGLASALYPAGVCAALSPAQALRHE